MMPLPSLGRIFASPLTRRVLAVNLLPPILLVAGLLYLDRYQQGLIRTELAGLVTQAEMVAGAVVEGAVTEHDHGQIDVNHALAQHLVRRLAKLAQLRARLFDADGVLAADSRFLLDSPHGAAATDVSDGGSYWWNRPESWMPVDKGLPLYQEHPDDKAADWPEVMAAYQGQIATQVRAAPTGGLVLTAAVPVQRYKRVAGIILVSADGRGIAKSLFQVRMAIWQTFLLTLAVTTGLSIFLAGTIATPIRRLSQAARMVRRGQGRRLEIPDFSDRHDEIGDLSKALADMTDALWTRMDAIERFAADVAHEIKNPLTSVRSAIETLSRISDPDRQRQLLSIVQDDVARLNRLISDISDASRIDAELSRAEMDEVPIAPLLQNLGEIYRVTTVSAALEFVVRVPDGDALVVGAVEDRLVQVLRNLIANAVSFSPPGGVVGLSAGRDGAYVVITIDDQGPGIPPNKTQAIFDRFYSERPQGEKFGTHSGLGLSISRQIIDAFGGTLQAENRLDETGAVCGARFVVRLSAGFEKGPGPMA